MSETMNTPRGGAECQPQIASDADGASSGEAKWMTLTWFLRPDRYEGEVVDGHMHGKGTYWHADGSRQRPASVTTSSGGERRRRQGASGFRSGDGASSEGEYEGSFHASQRQGYGEYNFADGAFYKGEYKAGAKDGYGVFVYRDQTRYEGTFQSNVKEGQGIMYYAGDGSKYIGDYHNGMMDGQGEYVWPNGVKYIGDWKNDERHGFGQMFFADSQPAYRAKWDHDQRVFA